ncbi:MAG: hypothetical protein R6U03_07375, partial [Gillisia sp.]
RWVAKQHSKGVSCKLIGLYCINPRDGYCTPLEVIKYNSKPPSYIKPDYSRARWLAIGSGSAKHKATVKRSVL